jgi:ribosome assembly protein 1
LKDLKERFAKIDIQSSSPIVPFRETIVAAAEMAPPKDPSLPRGTIIAITPSKQITVRIRTRPLPAAVAEFLVQNSASIKSLYSSKRGKEALESNEDGEEDKAARAKLNLMEIEEFKQGLQKAFDSAPPKERDVWAGVVDKIIAFGPRRVGPNLLIDATLTGGFRKL